MLPPNSSERPTATGGAGGHAPSPPLPRTGSPAGTSALAGIGRTGGAPVPAVAGGPAAAPALVVLSPPAAAPRRAGSAPGRKPSDVKAEFDAVLGATQVMGATAPGRLQAPRNTAQRRSPGESWCKWLYLP